MRQDESHTSILSAFDRHFVSRVDMIREYSCGQSQFTMTHTELSDAITGPSYSPVTSDTRVA